MTREIKFRGKRLDNGEWVYGYYFKAPLTAETWGCDYFSSGVNRNCIADEHGVTFEIDPATVGQWTGLKDKNGREIWEGDVLLGPSDSATVLGAAAKNNRRLLVKWLVEWRPSAWQGSGFQLTALGERERTCPRFDECERMTTIHDNPELLEAPHE